MIPEDSPLVTAALEARHDKLSECEREHRARYVPGDGYATPAKLDGWARRAMAAALNAALAEHMRLSAVPASLPSDIETIAKEERT